MTATCSGLSLNAGVHVDGNDRERLQRVLRYGSRPPFAAQRLSVLPDGKVRLELRKPTYRGQTEIVFEPLAFLKRRFAIIAPPRWHLTRYHGIFSSHHRLRSQLEALLPRCAEPARRCGADDATEHDAVPLEPMPPEPLPPAKRPSYARLLARVFPDDLGACTKCGGTLRLIAGIDKPKAITAILTHLGLPTDVPRIAPARSPPQLTFDDVDALDDVFA